MDLPRRTVLLLEDHGVTRALIAENLSADGYDVRTAGTLAAGLEALGQGPPDVVVLDLILPDGDGLELLRRLREGDGLGPDADPDVAVLVLSGRAGELDRLRGFARGCDDYLAKPFSYPELRARLEALLRRTAGSGRASATRVRCGPLALDLLTRTVRLRGEPVEISKKEFALLHRLASDPHRVFTRAELLGDVWGMPSGLESRTLDSHAFRLRRKLARDGDRFIVNVWGVGYRLATPEAA